MFALAVAVVLLWATPRHLFDYSDTWQLVINTRYHYCKILDVRDFLIPF